jgi:hypothetical protein
MLLAIFFNYLLLLSLFGYSLILKKFFNKIKVKIENVDFFYGFLLFFSKSLRFFKLDDYLSVQGRLHDFSKIQKIGTFNNVEIYYKFWQCADYELVFVNIPKDKYNISKKYSYTFFKMIYLQNENFNNNSYFQ